MQNMGGTYFFASICQRTAGDFMICINCAVKDHVVDQTRQNQASSEIALAEIVGTVGNVIG